MTCTHPHGDYIDGYWLCGWCYTKLEQRPACYHLETADSSDNDIPSGTRQAVYPAPLSRAADGTRLSVVLDIVAQRLIDATLGSMNRSDAIDYTIDLLKLNAEPFSSADADWSADGVWELVQEDMQHWDIGDGAGRNH